MSEEKRPWDILGKYLQQDINKVPRMSTGKYTEVSEHSGSELLDQIRVGDRISSPDGKWGIVADIEVLRRHGEVLYYFRLEKSAGMILVIK
jgi:hypothetical protein